MGYNTEYKGDMLFVKDVSGKQLNFLNKMFGEDCREHPEWGATELYYIDLKLNDDFSGICWNGAEKTYFLENAINVVIREMRKEWPDFALHGTISAQGDDIDDKYALVVSDDGFVHKRPIMCR